MNDSDSDSEDGDLYEVEAILDDRVTRGVREFFVQWVGYPSSENCWILESNMDCPDLLATYDESKKNKKTKAEPNSRGKKRRNDPEQPSTSRANSIAPGSSKKASRSPSPPVYRGVTPLRKAKLIKPNYRVDVDLGETDRIPRRNAAPPSRPSSSASRSTSRVPSPPQESEFDQEGVDACDIFKDMKPNIVHLEQPESSEMEDARRNSVRKDPTMEMARAKTPTESRSTSENRSVTPSTLQKMLPRSRATSIANSEASVAIKKKTPETSQIGAEAPVLTKKISSETRTQSVPPLIIKKPSFQSRPTSRVQSEAPILTKKTSREGRKSTEVRPETEISKKRAETELPKRVEYAIRSGSSRGPAKSGSEPSSDPKVPPMKIKLPSRMEQMKLDYVLRMEQEKEKKKIPPPSEETRDRTPIRKLTIRKEVVERGRHAAQAAAEAAKSSNERGSAQVVEIGSSREGNVLRKRLENVQQQVAELNVNAASTEDNHEQLEVAANSPMIDEDLIMTLPPKVKKTFSVRDGTDPWSRGLVGNKIGIMNKYLFKINGRWVTKFICGVAFHPDENNVVHIHFVTREVVQMKQPQLLEDFYDKLRENDAQEAAQGARAPRQYPASVDRVVHSG